MKKMSRLIVMVALTLSLCAPNSNAQKSLLKQFEAEFVALSETVSPSVVEISVTTRTPSAGNSQTPNRLDDMFKFFGLPSPKGGGGEEDEDAPSRPPMRTPSSTGTGFFIDDAGHIVTNNHVVDGATAITVELFDGTEVAGEIVGQDPGADIAVIKVDPGGIAVSPVTLGSSSDLKVGQFAIAIGSARGQTGSVSYGHISGLHREGLQLPDRDLRFQEFIQTDAAINLGNSGGPLCNIDGEVIGVNVAIVYDANSIGFAIPVDRVKLIVPQLIADGGVTRGWLGVAIWNIEQQAMDEELEVDEFVDANGLESANGSVVRSVTVDGPAASAGIISEDIILQINDHKITNTTDLINYVSDLDPKTSGKMILWRSGKLVELDITIGKFPGMLTAQFGKSYFGIHVTTLPELEAVDLDQLGLEKQPSDFRVIEIVEGSPAAEAGIQRGDVIVEVAHQEVATLEQFKEVLAENARPGKTLLLRVRSLLRAEAEARKVYIKVPDDYVAN
jgi:serine protease Do